MNRKRVKLSNCQNCENEDNMNMVQCDRCDKWSHYDCVGVDADVEDVEWFCDLCIREIGILLIRF